MLDVSNNSLWLSGHPSYWKLFYRSGQRRAYCKSSEGATFRDATRIEFETYAQRAGLLVGFFHFARPSTNGVHAELTNALEALPTMSRRRNLRFALDVEDPRVTPSRAIGSWVEEFCAGFHRAMGYLPVVYGSYSYLQACKLNRSAVGPLWLAWYTHDGTFHGATNPPSPWKRESALQYTDAFSYGWMPHGAKVDMSHVFDGRALSIPFFSRR